MTPDMEMRISARNNTGRAFSEVRADLHRTGAAMTPLERNVERIGNMVGMLPGIFGAAFAGISVEQFARAITDATHAVAELSRQAEMTGVSFEAFQSLDWVAQKNGIDSIGQALREMQDKASEFARDGGGRAAGALMEIGFSATATAKALKDPEDMFKEIIQRVSELDDKSSQIRILGDIFGNADGDKLLRLLDDGRTGIEAMQQEAVESGLVIGDELEGAAKRADTAFALLWRKLEVGFKSFAVMVSSWLTESGNWTPGGPAAPGTGGWGSLPDLNSTPGPWGPIHIPSTMGPAGETPSTLQSYGGYIPPGGNGTTRDLGSLGGFSDFLEAFGLKPEKIDKVTQSVGALDLGIKNVTKTTEDWTDVLADRLGDSMVNVVETLISGGNAAKAFADELGNLGKMALSAGIKSLVNWAVGGLFGGFAPAGFTGNFSIGNMATYAGGTDFHPGGWAMVGEQGPEIVNLPRGSQVIPAGESSRMMGGGGVTNVFHIDARGAQMGVGEQIRMAIETVVPRMIQAQAPAAVAKANYNGQRG